MVDSDEDDDSYVDLGEWIGPASADEPTRKPVSVHDLEVRDSQGRVRFHGAFTGGFSAGYFNTVGSKEGWKPSTFVSNRENRPKQKSATPEDFMDDEDFGEHGIAPRQIVTSDNFKSEELQRKRKAMASAMTSDSIFLPWLDSTLLDLIVPEKLSIGVKLLRKMGWKEGQGVGPRYEKKKKKQKKKKSDNVKIYGCTLPETDSESESSDAYIPESVTFAPKDTCPISFVRKDNTHGLGYSGINVKAALSSGHLSLFSELDSKSKSKSKFHSKKGIHGSAFGVGALEEDDDDIYSMENLSNYDQSIGPEVEDNLFGWTAPGQNKPGRQLPSTYVGKMLEGFTLASNSLPARKVYSLPVIPRSYKPFHVFKEIPCDLKPVVPDQKNQPLNAHSRSILLGEISSEGSVFDLLKKDDADYLAKISESKQKSSIENQALKPEASDSDCLSQSLPATEKKSVTSSTSPICENTGSSHPSQEKNDSQSMEAKQMETDANLNKLEIKPFKIQATQLPLTSNCLQSEFQPFAKDPAKQERYNRYLLLLKHGKIDPYDEVSAGCEMTEWERTKEKDEFSRSAKIYKPLSGFMATRFTSAKLRDDDDDSTKLSSDNTADNDLSRAADMNLFGKLTREMFEWHPDQLLCRRFNVPDPHPGSGIIGIPKVKRDKYSVFNFLDANQPKGISPAIKQSEKTKDSNSSATASTSFGAAPSTGSAHQGKPSIFSHLMDSSPIENQHTKSPTNNAPTEANASTQPTLKTDSAAEIKDDERPPLDLFKAIFADSSSDFSSDEEKEEMKEAPPETISYENSHPVENTIKDLPLYDSGEKTSNLKSNAESSSKKSFWDCVLNNEKKDDDVCKVTQGKPTEFNLKQEKINPEEVEEEEEEEEAYGPALPPPFPSSSNGTKGISTSNMDERLLSLMKSSPMKKHKHKSKHKSKKSKKAKHKNKKEKRHKDKKKKKKQQHSSSKRRHTSSSSSSSELSSSPSSSSASSSSSLSSGHKKKKKKHK